MTGGSLQLADLAKAKALSAPRLAGLGGIAIAVAGLFLAAGALAERWTVWQAESFGDRRLGTPSPAECQIARVLMRDLRDRDRVALLRGVGAAGEDLQLRAFAWRSDGERVPPGLDWRKCPGLGPFVRAMGMAHLGSGDAGPALYISRAAMNPAGDAATVSETFRAPHDVRDGAVVKAWTAELRRGSDGIWRLVRRSAAPAPRSDFRH